MFNRLLAIALAALSVVVAIPLGGFVYGMQHCQGCDSVSDRLFMGCVGAVLSVFGGGFPGWADGKGTPRANAWPQILAFAGVIFCLLFTVIRVNMRRAKRIRESWAD